MKTNYENYAAHPEDAKVMILQESERFLNWKRYLSPMK